jgi:hypothetical protein
MYKSPIGIFMGEMQTKVEDDIYSVIQKYDIVVDKDELIKAINYDRGQYDKGYIDGILEVACKLREIYSNPDYISTSSDILSQVNKILDELLPF